MKIRMLKNVSGYVHGGVRLPTVGVECDVDDDTGDMLIRSGNAEAVAGSAKVETAAAAPADAETATAKTPAKRRKTR